MNGGRGQGAVSQRLLGESCGAGNKGQSQDMRGSAAGGPATTFQLSELVDHPFSLKPFGNGFSDTCKQES